MKISLYKRQRKTIQENEEQMKDKIWWSLTQNCNQGRINFSYPYNPFFSKFLGFFFQKNFFFEKKKKTQKKENLPKKWNSAGFWRNPHSSELPLFMSLGTFSNLLDIPESNLLVMRQEFTQISILIDAFRVLLFVLANNIEIPHENQ